jgi:hypothetical protein
MSEETFNPSPENSESEQIRRKRAQWDQKMEEMLKPDTYGYVLDEGIRDTVVALQLMGINTTQSDQGNYSDSPWIEVMAEYPKNVYEGEADLKQRLMQERDIRSEVIDEKSLLFNRAIKVDIEGGARAKLRDTHAVHTPEYEIWRTSTLQIVEKLEKLIGEFYTPHHSPTSDLAVAVRFPYQTPDHAAYPDIYDIPHLEVIFETEAPENAPTEVHQERSMRARREMNRFTDFLKERFFATP